jgi:hypothetical protein
MASEEARSTDRQPFPDQPGPIAEPDRTSVALRNLRSEVVIPVAWRTRIRLIAAEDRDPVVSDTNPLDVEEADPDRHREVLIP